MNFDIKYELEGDGRWIAEVPEVPGAMAYGATKEEAKLKVESLLIQAQAKAPEYVPDSPVVRELYGAFKGTILPSDKKALRELHAEKYMEHLRPETQQD